MDRRRAGPPAIERCPVTGLWLLPPGDGPATRYLASWHDLNAAARAVVLPAVKAAAAEDRRLRRPPADRVVELRFALVPRPDNDHDNRAVAVVPVDRAGLVDVARQVAWITRVHLNSLRPSIIGLMETTGEPVGCRGLLRLSSYVVDDYDDDPDVGWDDDDDPVLTYAESRRYQYTFEGFRAQVGPWDEVRQALLEFAEPRVRDRILPVVSRWAPWKLDRDDPARVALAELARLDVEFVAGPGTLEVRFDGLLLADLDVQPAGFFARTRERVLELGGRAGGRVEPHTNGLEVYVQDDRPVEELAAILS